MVNASILLISQTVKFIHQLLDCYFKKLLHAVTRDLEIQ